MVCKYREDSYESGQGQMTDHSNEICEELLTSEENLFLLVRSEGRQCRCT
jgi:hypothetical protein